MTAVTKRKQANALKDKKTQVMCWPNRILGIMILKPWWLAPESSDPPDDLICQYVSAYDVQKQWIRVYTNIEI